MSGDIVRRLRRNTDAIEQAGWAKEAGAQALDIMPPHHWLRFGFRPSHVIDYFKAIGEASGLPLIVHVYPAWTKASFSSELLAELALLPSVQAFKIGTREMNKYKRDLQMIRAAAPEKACLTCHDEYLLPSMVQGVDGALVGFASVIPGIDPRPAAGGESGRPHACRRHPGAHRSAERCRLWCRRADRRSARQHEGRHGRRRHFQKRRHAPADHHAECRTK